MNFDFITWIVAGIGVVLFIIIFWLLIKGQPEVKK